MPALCEGEQRIRKWQTKKVRRQSRFQEYRDASNGAVHHPKQFVPAQTLEGAKATIFDMIRYRTLDVL